MILAYSLKLVEQIAHLENIFVHHDISNQDLHNSIFDLPTLEKNIMGCFIQSVYIHVRSMGQTPVVSFPRILCIYFSTFIFVNFTKICLDFFVCKNN